MSVYCGEQPITWRPLYTRNVNFLLSPVSEREHSSRKAGLHVVLCIQLTSFIREYLGSRGYCYRGDSTPAPSLSRSILVSSGVNHTNEFAHLDCRRMVSNTKQLVLIKWTWNAQVLISLRPRHFLQLNIPQLPVILHTI